MKIRYIILAVVIAASAAVALFVPITTIRHAIVRTTRVVSRSIETTFEAKPIEAMRPAPKSAPQVSRAPASVEAPASALEARRQTRGTSALKPAVATPAPQVVIVAAPATPAKDPIDSFLDNLQRMVALVSGVGGLFVLFRSLKKDKKTKAATHSSSAKSEVAPVRKTTRATSRQGPFKR